jgi:hypothetical protein
MPKYIIQWDSGYRAYGANADIVEATDLAQAEKLAHEAWQQDIEANADYGAEEYTKERAVELGLEEEESEDGEQA